MEALALEGSERTEAVAPPAWKGLQLEKIVQTDAKSSTPLLLLYGACPVHCPTKRAPMAMLALPVPLPAWRSGQDWLPCRALSLESYEAQLARTAGEVMKEADRSFCLSVLAWQQVAPHLLSQARGLLRWWSRFQPCR